MTTAIVIDNGLYTELALTLGRAGWEVHYYTPWQRSYPLAKDMTIGAGFEDENLTRINHPLQYIYDEEVIWVFPDLYHNDLQTYLRKLGRNVWGCGDGDLLERDRCFFYQTLRQGGQNVADFMVVQGVEQLRAELEDSFDKFVKISTYRGEMETHHHKDWAKSRPWYDDLVMRLGPLGEAMQFIIQEPIESDLEIGLDWIYQEGWDYSGMIGAESKDKAYLGKVVSSGLDEFTGMIDALKTPMKEAGYRNFFSLELRRDKKGRWYATDATCRLPSPPFEGQLVNIANLPEVIRDQVGSMPRKTWVAQLILRSPWATAHPLRVEVPDEYRALTKLYRLLRADGGLWVMPDETGMSEVGSVVGLGDSPEEAMEQCRIAAKEVDGYQLEYDDKALNEAFETMQKMEEYL